MKIQKKASNLIFFQIYFVCVIRFFIYDLGLPTIFYYLTDVINLLIFISTIKKIMRDKSLNKFKIIILLMIICSIISYIYNEQNIYSYIWGIRNLYRFFTFFLGCIVLLNKEDYDKMQRTFRKLLVINFILVLYQYFVKQYFQDLINGTFGSSWGGNGYINVFMCIVIIDIIYKFMKNEISLREFAFYSGMTLIISVLSELKIFFIEYAIIYMFFLITLKKNFKIIFITVLVFLFLNFAISLFHDIYGFDNIFSTEGILQYSANNSYSSTMELNRMTAIKILDEKFMKTFTNKIVGLGLGNTDTSNIDEFNSDFYKIYGAKLKYQWFSDAIIFLENGYLGLSLYIIFIIRMSVGLKDKEFKYINYIYGILSIVLIIYNNSLKVESAYLWFAMMSFGFIEKDKDEKIESNKSISEVENEKMCNSYIVGR